MGQVQSEVASNGAVDPPNGYPSSSTADGNSQTPSMDSLMAEAAAFSNDNENESLDAKAQKALECPCISHLRSGPCGTQFSQAFLCFLKSTAEEKGSDCVHPFVALQSCIKENPNAFSKDILEAGEVEQVEKPAQEHKIIPPIWSVESSSPKHTF